MATGGESISPKTNLVPVANYLLAGFSGRGVSGPMMGTAHETKGLTGGPQLEYDLDQDAGMKGPFKLSDRPAYGQYKTYGGPQRSFSMNQRPRSM